MGCEQTYFFKRLLRNHSQVINSGLAPHLQKHEIRHHVSQVYDRHDRVRLWPVPLANPFLEALYLNLKIDEDADVSLESAAGVDSEFQDIDRQEADRLVVLTFLKSELSSFCS